MKFWNKILEALSDCNFETDDWQAYESIIPSGQHKVGKDLTYYIEGFNAMVRARCSRLVRKTLSFSKLDKWLSYRMAFMAFNLEQ